MINDGALDKNVGFNKQTKNRTKRSIFLIQRYSTGKPLQRYIF